MFCIKCGKELPNDACFCTYCGNMTSNSTKSRQENNQVYIPSQPVRTEQRTVPVNYSTPASYSAPINHSAPVNMGQQASSYVSSDYKDWLITGTGILYIIVGIISSIVTIVSQESAPLYFSVDLKAILVISALVGILIAVIFGLNIIFKKKWAAFTVRIFMILGIVSNLFALIQYSDILDLGSTFLSIGYQVLMIILTSVSIKFVDEKYKYYQTKYSNTSLKYDTNSKEQTSFWTCRKCGAHNSSGTSFCKDCGSYK